MNVCAFSLLLLAGAFAPAAASAQDGTVRGSSVAATQDSLSRQAKITPDSARKVALRHASGGTIESAELEHEHGKLVYSYDIKVPGKTGVDEVQVDARTGHVVSFKHEPPAAEAQEHQRDSVGHP